MENSLKKRRSFVIYILLIIVMCAVVNRFSTDIGYIATMLTLIYYVMREWRINLYYVKNFKDVNNTKKIKAVSAVAMVLVIVASMITSNMQYFFMVALLTIDYIIYDHMVRNKKTQ